jgi:hypothetical protein
VAAGATEDEIAALTHGLLPETYPKKVCFMAWSDKIDEFAIKDGESLARIIHEAA